MKELTTYIKEELDNELIPWKIEAWFRNRPGEYKLFCDIVDKCVADHTVSKDNLEEYLKDSKFKLKSFIDFMDDDVYGDTEAKDYLYLLKKVIECIIANKQLEM